MYPSQIKKELEKLHDQYLEGINKLAQKVMNDKLKPYLTEKGLALVCMNGFLQCWDCSDNPQELPKVVQNLLDINAPCGHPFIYELPDFNPFNQNFSDLDIKAFNKSVKNKSFDESVLSCWQTAHLY